MPTPAETRAANDKYLKSLQDEQKRLQAKSNRSKSDETRLIRLKTLISSRSNVLFRDAKTADWTAERNRQFGVKNTRARSDSWTTARNEAFNVGAQRKVADGQSNPYGVSAQTKAKRDDLRNMFGLGGVLADKGLLQQTFQIDPNTGQPMEDAQGNPIVTGLGETPAAAGVRFGPASAGGGQRSGSNLKGRDLSMLSGMSVRDVMDFYYSLSPEELTAVQVQLMNMGQYKDSKPVLGMRDQETDKALTGLMLEWAVNPNMSFSELSGRLKAEANAKLKPEVDKMSGIGVVPDATENITVTDDATLDRLIDSVSVEIFGSKIDAAQKSSLIARLQAQEKDYKMAGAQQSFDQNADAMRKEAAASAGGDTAGEIDRFIGALIGQESGGDPNAVNARTGAAGLGQIMGDQWGPWAREAGADPGDFSAENQMRVIRYQVGKYYQQFGNWRDVAFAWYGGGGAPAEIRSGNWSATRPQGNGDEPSFNEYADSLLAKMGKATTAALQQGAQPQGKLSFTVGQSLPDDRTRVEQELRAADPSRYAGTQFQRQAENFFGLLRGVI